MVELSPLRPNCPSLTFKKETVWSFTHLDEEMKSESEKSLSLARPDHDELLKWRAGQTRSEAECDAIPRWRSAGGSAWPNTY